MNIKQNEDAAIHSPSIDTGDELFKRLYPVLLDIFCRGLIKANGFRVIFASVVTTLIIPISWLVIPFRKFFDFMIWLAVLAFVYVNFIELQKYLYLALILVSVAILYKEIRSELKNLCIQLFIVCTGGGLLRWICAGAAEGNYFRKQLLSSDSMTRIINTYLGFIDPNIRSEYDRFMDKYLDRYIDNNIAVLESMINRYWENGSYTKLKEKKRNEEMQNLSSIVNFNTRGDDQSYESNLKLSAYDKRMQEVERSEKIELLKSIIKTKKDLGYDTSSFENELQALLNQE